MEPDAYLDVPFDAAPFMDRRAALGRALGDRTALIFAGRSSPRNYPANRYPFRASSHFLYFVGVPFEGAILRLEGEQATLFLEPPPPDDALWHGRRPSLVEHAARLGVAVRPLRALTVQDRFATLPGVDRATAAEQRARFGREIGSSDDDIVLRDAVIALRLRHDEHAQASLREAAEATVEAHRTGLAASAVGVHEAEVRAAMEASLRRRNMGVAYPPIVTTRGEVLHNALQRHICAAGDLLLADVGAETRGGWAGDVTRTWPVSGRFEGLSRDLYEAVHRAQRDAIEMVAPGIRFRDVHLRACRSLAASLVGLEILAGDPDELVAEGAHALLFPHGVGHLLGLDVHDMEDLGDHAGYAPGRSRSDQFGLSYLRLDRDLEAGMAVTIEPGLYVIPALLDDPVFAHLTRHLAPGARERLRSVRGIRIEDDVLVTERGAEVLTRALPSEREAVEALARAEM